VQSVLLFINPITPKGAYEIKKSPIMLDWNVKLCYTYNSGGRFPMDEFVIRCVIVFGLFYLAFHVVVDLILTK
jgi:hypothetical protein